MARQLKFERGQIRSVDQFDFEAGVFAGDEGDVFEFDVVVVTVREFCADFKICFFAGLLKGISGGPESLGSPVSVTELYEV